MNRILFAALVGAGLAQAAPAAAFNITNHTEFPICVTGNKGHYSTIVQPNSTDPGWYYNGTIKLGFATFNRHDYSGDGSGYPACNVVGTEVSVAPHVQVHIMEALFDPGHVGNERRAKQLVMWGLGFAATFKIDIP